MKTYQDLLAVGKDEAKRKDFVRSLIYEHQGSDDYKIAKDAYSYYCHKNVTINEYQKILYKVTGEAIPDNYSANYKMACRHFKRFLTQQVQYLLGNGVSWNNEGTGESLGVGGRSFDRQVKNAATKALWGKVAFGFFNKDHVDVFSYLEFAPLFDETNGSLMAGVRYWQIDSSRPLIATLYEVDGYTKYVYDSEENSTVQDEEKRSYILKIAETEADGIEIYDSMNYPTFPIVPLWANEEHQSEIVGLREQIDCYDLIKSGFANTVDEASIVYWTLQNAGGMDDIDLAKFVHHIRTLHAATVEDDGASAQSHTIEAPYASREALLDRLDADLYRDAMALDTQKIAGGAVSATQIRAAYENLNSKTDEFEYQVLDFIDGILAVAGIEDEATFTRSQLLNQEEMIGTLVEAAQYLPDDYVTAKILEILGDGDKVDEALKMMDKEQLDRFNAPTEEDDEIEE